MLQRIAFRDPGVDLSGGADRPLQRLVVHFRQTESGVKTFRPFEIVQQRPVEIAADIGAGLNRSSNGGEMISDVIRPLVVVGVRDPVLGDVDRQVELFKSGDNIG